MLKKITRHGLFLLSILLLVIPLVRFGYSYLDNDQRFSRLFSGKSVLTEKTIRYKLEIMNPQNKPVDNAMIQLALPANISRQAVRRIEASMESETVSHDLWNQSLLFYLPKLTPYETRIIDVRVELAMYEQSIAESLLDQESYLKVEKYLEFTDPQLQQVLGPIKMTNQRDVAKELYTWISENVTASGFLAQERGALHTLQEKTGDCTGHMYLFGALARAKGIPARMMSGFIVESNKLLKAQDYHNWAEIYIDGAWRVVDSMNKNFMESEDHYVAMKVTVPSKANSFAWSQRLFSAPSGLKVRLL
ncbi:MAG: transglutaminase-like domain-containing protein [Candidatus Thiothrix putei]|uniref:Transglutaminase-like domain-containing protein n=1 Tax=Candidatus Thiothrix putei TaxID=3080811 RepID=A0AA95HI22_9GAMM|nr:MAG: transglutaminase-like domain-containing protein [Candidatus Thiothrix putei]